MPHPRQQQASSRMTSVIVLCAVTTRVNERFSLRYLSFHGIMPRAAWPQAVQSQRRTLASDHAAVA